MTHNYIDGLRGRGAFTLGDRKRPNILFISFDMVPREFYLPAEGDLAPRTPNLDALRRDGLFFSNAYAASPLCSPSRAALFTGRYSYITSNGERAHDGHQVHVREDDTIYPEYLKASGYRTRHFGKCHIGTAKFMAAFGENDHPWDRWSPPWYDDDGYCEFLAQKDIAGFRFSREIHGIAPSGRGKGNFMGGWVETENGKPFQKEATYPAYTTALALAGLRAREADPRPFYFEVDYFEPHQPFFIPSGYEQRERELRALVTIPQSWETALSGQGGPLPTVYARYQKYWGLSERQTVEDYLVANVLQYEILDENVGKLLSYLKAQDLYDECLIIATADHGEMNCRNGLIDKGAYLNPRVLQVPLTLKLPASRNPSEGDATPCSTVDRAVSLLDIAPTVLEEASVNAIARFDGVPLVGNHAPRKGGNRPPILAEVFSHVVPNPSASLLEQSDGRSRLYTVNFSDVVDEYYVQDPQGRWVEQNGIGDPENREDILSMRKALLRIFESDERWNSYAAFLRLVHAESFADDADLQKFVLT